MEESNDEGGNGSLESVSQGVAEIFLTQDAAAFQRNKFVIFLRSLAITFTKANL